MVEKRGKKRPFGLEVVKEEEVVITDNGLSSDSSVSEVQEARVRLRERWELASVLNFLQVFRPVIRDDLKISGAQIEEGLIRPNGVLAKIHVALLKGIPPVSKNLGMTDAWVTALCKKIDTWWPWVAEGDLPLVANHGVEIARYKEFDSTTRLMILKALCEIRAEQDDIVGYIEETLKSGFPLSTFRKDKIGGGTNGATYWFDGDPDLGYRLYREILLVDSKQRAKGKGHSTKPTVDFLWETLATDTEEFRNISVSFSDSKNREETVVGNIVKSDIMPIVEKLQKKKERALKRRQTETMLLTCSLGTAIGSRRSCRDRRPVNYTFDDFDRSISEAIQIENKLKAEEMSKGSVRKRDLVENNVSLAENKSNATLEGTTDGGDKNSCSDRCDKSLDNDSSDDDEDYNEWNVEDDDDDNFDLDSDKEADSDDSNKKTRILATHGNSRPGQKHKYNHAVAVEGLRRSTRNSSNTNLDIYKSFSAEAMGHADMKKRLRQRPIRNVDYEHHVVPDSEDENES